MTREMTSSVICCNINICSILTLFLLTKLEKNLKLFFRKLDYMPINNREKNLEAIARRIEVNIHTNFQE